MKHSFVEDKSVDVEELDEVTLVEVCKFCDVQKWHWLHVAPGVIKPQQYMLLKGLQYWNPDEECTNPYNLQQLNLF